MQKKVFSEERIIRILKLQESRFSVVDAIRKVFLTDFNKHFRQVFVHDFLSKTSDFILEK